MKDWASDAVGSWADSIDQAGAEVVREELQYVLGADAAARAGGAPVAREYGACPDAGESLRHAAARLDQLTSISELSSGGVERGWPGDAASALREASRVGELLAKVVAAASGPVLDKLEQGGLVAPGGVRDQRGMVEEIAELLGEAASRLEELSGRIGSLRLAVDAGNDGPTLDGEGVLRWRMPGAPSEGRFHLRVFRPLEGVPVVVIGDMGDDRSQSITTVVGEVASVVAERWLGGASLDSYRWILVEPPGKFSDTERGVIQRVWFEAPYGRRQDYTHAELEELVGGAVRRWHSSEYAAQPRDFLSASSAVARSE